MKPHIILDLDQTLIDSTKKANFNFKVHYMRNPDTKKIDYVVHERPYTQKFLNFLFSNFNVSIWTAASLDYAVFVFKEVIKRRNIKYFFFDYHCGVSLRKSKMMKNISLMGVKLPIIIDDNPDVQCENIRNGKRVICAPPFFVKNQNDKFLLDLISELKKDVTGNSAVRKWTRKKCFIN